jgi:thiol-disulfide isomerase/thioredoxin
MRYFAVGILLAYLGTLIAQDKIEGPTNEKAQKTYTHALELLRKHDHESALDNFKKADKQDGGHCMPCHKQMITLGMELRDWKAAETGASEIIAEARSAKAEEQAVAHFNLGMVLLAEGIVKHHDDLFSRSHDEFAKAISIAANFPDAVLSDGQALAYLKRDDEAKAQFEKFTHMRPQNDVNVQRARRFIADPELARARMAPAFEVTALNGEKVSLDGLTGKVVLLDFWATWCAPCREALPHMKEIARKFQDQPLVILSISLDDDEHEWKDFVEKNGMTWLQYRDGSFKGPISRLFGVEAIPQTFTIAPDGVLQDQQIGDASIEGTLKKLCGRARQLQAGGKPAS